MIITLDTEDPALAELLLAQKLAARLPHLFKKFSPAKDTSARIGRSARYSSKKHRGSWT